MTARVLIVEDHPTLRQMLTDYVGMMPDLEVSGAVGCGADALAMLERTPVDVLLVDMSLPDMKGVDIVAEVQRIWPGVRCAVVSGHRARPYVDNSLAAGALAYVLKDDLCELARAIERILAGQVFVSSSLRWTATPATDGS